MCEHCPKPPPADAPCAWGRSVRITHADYPCGVPAQVTVLVGTADPRTQQPTGVASIHLCVRHFALVDTALQLQGVVPFEFREQTQ